MRWAWWTCSVTLRVTFLAREGRDLSHKPVADPAGNAPAFVDLESTSTLRHGPVAPSTGIAPVSTGRQPARDTSRVRRHSLHAGSRTQHELDRSKSPASGGTCRWRQRSDLNRVCLARLCPYARLSEHGRRRGVAHGYRSRRRLIHSQSGSPAPSRHSRDGPGRTDTACSQSKRAAFTLHPGQLQLDVDRLYGPRGWNCTSGLSVPNGARYYYATRGFCLTL